jgi:hypothetical protein
MIYSNRPCSPTGVAVGSYRAPILETYDGFMFVHSRTLVLLICPLSQSNIETCAHFVTRTHMRLDHFGHNYEFSVTARSLTLKTNSSYFVA